MQLSQKVKSLSNFFNFLKIKKLFLNYFLHFQNLYEILNIFQEKMTFIADVFPEMPTSKNMVR